MDIFYWRELNNGFIDFLIKKGYTYDITRHYRGTINLLIRFVNANGYKAYTQEIGDKFLESEERLMYLPKTGYQRQRLVIRRLNEYLDGGKYSYTYLRVNYECPETFKEGLEHYLKSLEMANLKQCTIDKYRVFTIKLCRDFARNGIESWDTVDAKAMSGAFDRAASKAQFSACIQKLFGFLVKEGIVKYNYAGIVPHMNYKFPNLPDYSPQSGKGFFLGRPLGRFGLLASWLFRGRPLFFGAGFGAGVERPSASSSSNTVFKV